MNQICIPVTDDVQKYSLLDAMSLKSMNDDSWKENQSTMKNPVYEKFKQTNKNSPFTCVAFERGSRKAVWKNENTTGCELLCVIMTEHRNRSSCWRGTFCGHIF